ncbi:Glycogen debranching enzyme [Echinococcus granulosus]|uniref:Glycogen debranching enzyme n=1 Tax=Echinococcus granulosus TaxID=6210 RepID=A0A068WLY7_ECHGR|nr:Glycogen debranching enzyme [Echinococcus granulosus]CDS18647.1 glycogen debranching enzyme [Echinococcus granulosus]
MANQVVDYYLTLGMNTETSFYKVKRDRFDDYFVLGPIQVSGAFHFAFTTDGSTFTQEMSDSKKLKVIGGKGYFVVESRFAVGDPEDLDRFAQWDLEGVMLQTYVAKNLGPFSEWRDRLRVAYECGYNMVHFTPIQELGISNSGYSLKDQLTVSSTFSDPLAIKKVGWEDVEELVKEMETEWSILSMCDLVLNHTAINSPWLHEHPECGYNLENSPHLVPAFLVDQAIWRTTLFCAEGKLVNKHIPPEFGTGDTHVDALRSYLVDQFKELKLHEFYQADIDLVSEEFKRWLTEGSNTPPYMGSDTSLTLRIVGTRAGRRMGATVDFALAREIFGHDTPDVAAHNLGLRLADMNRLAEETMIHNLLCAADCVAGGARYRFVDPNGPLLGTVSESAPLVDRYFLCPEDHMRTAEEAEQLATGDRAKYVMGCNGWIINSCSIENFAEVDSNVYLRRELVIWGDSVKLRYGDKPEDCPYLWNHMLEYARMTARVFHGVRLDNCHSTPLHVAQAILDACREVRPSIYVIGEVFTNDEKTDNLILNNLGICSLIREALSAHDCHDEGRLVHYFGGHHPAGGFPHAVLKRRLLPTVAHALFYDQTHDNPAPAVKRTIFDHLPSSALVAMAACSSASTRGYDELVPYQIDVVSEKRFYARWDKDINASTGMIRAKAALNRLHRWMAANNFNETFVDQVDTNVIAVTRFSADTAESIVMVSHSCFYDRSPHPAHHPFRKIMLNGRVRRILIEARTKNHSLGNPMDDFKWNECYINGLTNISVEVKEDMEVSKSKMFKVVHVEENGGTDALEFYDFPPGCIVAVSVCLNDVQSEALSRVRGTLLHQFGRRLRTLDARKVSLPANTVAIADALLPLYPDSVEHGLIKRLINDLSLTDINWLLYRCEREENVPGLHRTPYYVPRYGDLVFCGLQGIVSVMRNVAQHNDLGHPVCHHLREGLWLLDYLYQRISAQDPSRPSKQLDALSRALKQLFQPIYDLPKYLIPANFGMLVGCLYQTVMEEIAMRLGKWTELGSSTVRNLVTASLQLYGKAPNVRLPPVLPAPSLSGRDDDPDRYISSLAAGLPHFAEGMWRNWGRDTFIALRGCLILTDRFEEAANAILQFASLLRHGLIPNLMGDGQCVPPRYNARDAVWFWLYSICCFEDGVAASEGLAPGCGGAKKSILSRPVFRWFISDTTPGWPDERDSVNMANPPADRVMPLYDVMQEALQRHVTGIEFRERTAGFALDCQMVTEGFNVKAYIQEDTGFVCGGNRHNCGTWMDKMGSSDKAGNRGKPATPRDGCAVELTGLAYAVLKWLERAHSMGGSTYYPHDGVDAPPHATTATPRWSWADWAAKIKNNFETRFWLPERNKEGDTCGQIDIHQGYYRDICDCSNPNAELQLRPNFLVAMTVAPDIFDVRNAWKALEITKKQLLGPLGMKTLDPRDKDYRCTYNNSDDSYDYSIAHGFNYHQGPEWLWPTGYYIRARLIMARRLADLDPSLASVRAQAVRESQEILLRFNNHIRASPWRSLPELTQVNGEFCPGSCASQAWSVGTAIEAIYDLLETNARMHGLPFPLA